MSETLDGQRVAPLMGNYPDSDVGTLCLRTLPNFWNHSSCDHAVSTRLLPAGPQMTRVRATWLVHEDAEPGKDYQLDALLPFWQRTSEQDGAIVKNAQRGVNSRAYNPGPFWPSRRNRTKNNAKPSEDAGKPGSYCSVDTSCGIAQAAPWSLGRT